MSGPVYGDAILIRCRYCGSEGRLYHEGHSIDYRGGSMIGGWSEECPACDGTGAELIEGEPMEEEDLWEVAAP